MGIHTIGQSVTAHEAVATIVPSKAPLIFSGYVNEKDVAELREGAGVSLKLDAYPYSEYGLQKGKISYISPSSVNLENVGQVYLVEAELENGEADGNLMSGLGGTAEIRIGKRTVLQYLFEPVLEGLHQSMKEK